MSAIRSVDELTDHAASTVVPDRVADTDPAPTPVFLKCAGCKQEFESLCASGRCAMCDEFPEVNEEPTNPIGPTAGIVRIPGEELFEALESEEDIVNANRELLEGRPLTAAESERWTRLFHEIMHEANKRLEKKGIVLLAAVPEPNGLGGVLTGCDRPSLDAASRGIEMPSEDYMVTISLPARERVDIARSEREEFARRLIDLVCSECIEQQAAYRATREKLH